MAPSTLWWLLAGAAIALELLTGTFYLLMLALGMAGAAVAAHLGAGSDPSARAQRSVNLDVGETVQIEAWNPDGTAAVKYRGANWTAIHRTGVSPSAGAHRVSELVGNRLLVDKL